jgi:hypothetical protein
MAEALGKLEPVSPLKGQRFRPFLCFSFEYFRYCERAGCLSYPGKVPNRRSAR